jgi:hypothetical protein
MFGLLQLVRSHRLQADAVEGPRLLPPTRHPKVIFRLAPPLFRPQDEEHAVQQPHHPLQTLMS